MESNALCGEEILAVGTSLIVNYGGSSGGFLHAFDHFYWDDFLIILKPAQNQHCLKGPGTIVIVH